MEPPALWAAPDALPTRPSAPGPGGRRPPPPPQGGSGWRRAAEVATLSAALLHGASRAGRPRRGCARPAGRASGSAAARCAAGEGSAGAGPTVGPIEWEDWCNLRKPGEDVGDMPLTFRSTAPDAKHEFRILCYGDSLTIGFNAYGRKFEPYGRALAETLAASGISSEISVCGLGGFSAHRMVRTLDAEDLTGLSGTGKGLRRILETAPEAPDLVLIMAGANDLSEGMKPQDIFRNVKALHEVCHARGVRTLAMAPPQVPSSSAPAPEMRRRLCRMMSDWAADTARERGAAPKAVYVDPAELVPAGVADGEDGIWDRDGFHLAPTGSKTLGRRLSSLVAETLVYPMGVPEGAESATLEAELKRMAAREAQDAAAGGAQAEEPAAATRGLEFWRTNAPEKPESVLGDIEDDFARGVLSRSVPIRSMALLFMEAEKLPCVGQEFELRLDCEGDQCEEDPQLNTPREMAFKQANAESQEDDQEPNQYANQIAAIQYANSWDGGVVACVPQIEGAVGLPWGGTGAELLEVVTLGENEALVRLRAVMQVKLVGRHPARKAGGCTVALLQEVPEQGNEELDMTAQEIAESAEELRALFAECSELQRVSGYTAAGDFTSATIEERVEAVLEKLKDVRLWGIRGEVDVAIRGAAAVTHAIVAAFSPNIRTRFLCEPQTLLPRLRMAKDFLEKVRSLLSTRLAFKRMEDGEQ